MSWSLNAEQDPQPKTFRVLSYYPRSRVSASTSGQISRSYPGSIRSAQNPRRSKARRPQPIGVSVSLSVRSLLAIRPTTWSSPRLFAMGTRVPSRPLHTSQLLPWGHGPAAIPSPAADSSLMPRPCPIWSLNWSRTPRAGSPIAPTAPLLSADVHNLTPGFNGESSLVIAASARWWWTRTISTSLTEIGLLAEFSERLKRGQTIPRLQCSRCSDLSAIMPLALRITFVLATGPSALSVDLHDGGRRRSNHVQLGQCEMSSACMRFARPLICFSPIPYFPLRPISLRRRIPQRSLACHRDKRSPYCSCGSELGKPTFEP